MKKLLLSISYSMMMIAVFSCNNSKLSSNEKKKKKYRSKKEYAIRHNSPDQQKLDSIKNEKQKIKF